MIVRFVPLADRELVAAIRWYQRQQVGLGHEFFQIVEESKIAIGENPGLAPRVEFVGPDREVRDRVLGKFPYSLIYHVGPTEILVVAVAHHKRQPGYWIRRLT